MSTNIVIIFFHDTSAADKISYLSERNEFMINLLSSISHELRTPLGGIMAQLECALADNHIKLEQKNKYLRPSFNCARLLLYFVNDLVDYVAQRTAQTVKLDIGSVNIRKIVGNIARLFELPAKQKKLELSVEVEAGTDACIMSDPRRIKQVLI